jgi:uncharacterized protein (TIGR00303 family)
MPFSIINNPGGQMDRILNQAKTAKSVRFVLCVGGTKTSDVEGLSGAGATPEDRRLTPRCDAEALVNGIEGKTSELPVSPEGIVSPVVITAACLKLLNIPVTVVDCGTFAGPRVGERIVIGTPPAECVSSGAAQELSNVEKLFKEGFSLGEKLSRESDLIIISECVPAGTTTAFAVLTGLGYDVHGAVSSSMPNFNHQMRWQFAITGLTKAGLVSSIKAGDPESTQKSIAGPLKVVAAVGDPMQPFAAGLALAASKTATVILGGGSQMLTVFSLAKACTRYGVFHNESETINVAENSNLSNIGVITTSWVAHDKNAKVSTISETVEAPFACSMLDFSQSSHVGLMAYEEGHVKEGVGAGASIVLTHVLKNLSATQLIEAIDETYSQMALGKTTTGC